MSQELPTLIFTALFGTILFLLLSGFIIYFLVIYNKKQIKYLQEKAKLKAQYEQEILTAENEIQDQTMKEISRELHDNVGQMLTLVKLQLNNLTDNFPENQKVINAKDYLSQAQADLRTLAKSLNSDNLLSQGLAQAIEFEIKRLSKIIEINFEFINKYESSLLDSKKEIIVFRMFQEILQNSLKHAQAKNITVNLEDSNQFFNLTFADNGLGFDIDKTNQLSDGSGLKNLYHRAQLLGGKIVINSGPTGTITTITIPKNTHYDKSSLD